MDWFRWHHGTATDPKWRVIARKSGQPIPAVLAVWAMVLESASQSTERGELSGWDNEDTAAALDMDAEEVAAIIDAMRGKVLDGNRLTGWEKRQPKRERDQPDNSAERVRAHREKKRQDDTNATTSDHVTPCNASNGTDKIRLEKKDSPQSPPGGQPDDFDRFWKAYPRRDGANPKQPARDKFARWVRKGAAPEAMIEAAEAYHRECEASGQIGTPYVAQAQTWLNQRRWSDYEPDPDDGREYPAVKAMLADEQSDCAELLRIRDAEGWDAAERYAIEHQRRTA